MIILPLGITWIDIVDVIIVALILYQILLWLRGTAGMELLRGLLIILLIYILAQRFGLETVNWLLEKFITVLLVVIIIVFQPELRRALERIGRGRFFLRVGLPFKGKEVIFVRQIIDAVQALSESHTGGLIVIERSTGLNEYLESGVKMDATVSTELLISIFTQKTPLHDGAVIIQEDRVAAATCLLPLSESQLIDRRLGTRHRAAIGITEQTDALVIVVSERTGMISIAENGYLTRFLTKELLEEKLFEVYKAPKTFFGIFPWFKKEEGEGKK